MWLQRGQTNAQWEYDSDRTSGGWVGIGERCVNIQERDSRRRRGVHTNTHTHTSTSSEYATPTHVLVMTRQVAHTQNKCAKRCRFQVLEASSKAALSSFLFPKASILTNHMHTCTRPHTHHTDGDLFLVLVKLGVLSEEVDKGTFPEGVGD